MTTWDIERYAKALEFATIRHMGQTYGGREQDQQIPYVCHLASVAAEVLAAFHDGAALGDVDLNLALECALLHDVLEDTATSFSEVQALFGDAVANGISALSKDTSIASRNEQMLDSLHRIRLQRKEIWMVKLADRISNLYHPPFYWSQQRIEQYREESQLILQELGDANPVLAQRLATKILQYGVPIKSQV